MKLADRVARQGEELAYLRAIVDGGEAQDREAIVALVGLLVSFAAKSGALDYERLLAFLGSADTPAEDPQDRFTLLLGQVRAVVAFHRDDGKGAPAGPVTPHESLGPDEVSDILRRARAKVDFDRAGPAPGPSGRGRGRDRGARGVSKH